MSEQLSEENDPELNGLHQTLADNLSMLIAQRQLAEGVAPETPNLQVQHAEKHDYTPIAWTLGAAAVVGGGYMENKGIKTEVGEAILFFTGVFAAPVLLHNIGRRMDHTHPFTTLYRKIGNLIGHVTSL